jgi:hypothetical protein
MARPCLNALRRALALPSVVRGPVLRFAFAWLAASLRAEDMSWVSLTNISDIARNQATPSGQSIAPSLDLTERLCAPRIRSRDLAFKSFDLIELFCKYLSQNAVSI